MAACVDDASTEPRLSREIKRSKYDHDFEKPRKTWQALHDDLIRIGHQYFDHTADLTFIEDSLHDAWDELFYIAKGTPCDSSEHDRLLVLVMTVRELGKFTRQRKCTTSASVEDVAVVSNGQQLWVDLPYLAQDLQSFWFNESMDLPMTERKNLAVLTSKLCATGVCSVELASCALWIFKEVLETDRTVKEGSQSPPPSLSDLLPACIEWLNYGNFKLALLSADNCNPAIEGDNKIPTSAGPLAVRANITQQGFSVARWVFWRKRLGELYLSGDQEVAKSARKGFEIMALTGLAIGLQIPGEHKYLEKLFEALDKELVALDGPGCVGPENIEIDPTWASGE
jgi:hypothetical protein